MCGLSFPNMLFLKIFWQHLESDFRISGTLGFVPVFWCIFCNLNNNDTSIFLTLKTTFPWYPQIKWENHFFPHFIAFFYLLAINPTSVHVNWTTGRQIHVRPSSRNFCNISKGTGVLGRLVPVFFLSSLLILRWWPMSEKLTAVGDRPQENKLKMFASTALITRLRNAKSISQCCY